MNVVLLACYLAFSLPAYAMPASKNCTAGCTSTQSWNFEVHGGMTTAYVPNLSLSGTQLLDRYITLGAFDSGKYQAAVGMEFSGPSATSPFFCPVGSVQWFYAFLDSKGNIVSGHCWNLAPADKGRTADIGVSYYLSNGGGAIIWVTNTGAGNVGSEQCYNGCFIPGSTGGDQNYSFIMILETIKLVVNGTFQGAFAFNHNKFDSEADSQWHFQTTRGLTASTNPPQMYWYPDPGHSSTGGSLVTCEKDSGTTC